MGKEKIEARLIEEIQRMELAGQAARPLSVIIQHLGPPSGPGDIGTRTDPSALEQRRRAEQQGIRNRLAELGVSGEIRTLALANALEVRLTPAQIRAIADHPDVKLIIFNREEKVTA